MTEINRQQEIKSWKRWKIITKISNLLKFGTILRTDSGKGFSLPEEPPMVGLDKLIHDGMSDEPEAEPFTYEMLQFSMTLYSSMKGDSVSDDDAATKFIETFINSASNGQVDQNELKKLLAKYHEGIDGYFQVKNDLFSLKQKLHKSQVHILVENLYRFVSRHELDSPESKLVFDAAERLGMSHTDIRQTATRVQKENK